jgi:plasmid maintenance system antidote protein VapI
MPASFWLNLQLRWDLYFAQRAEEVELATITPHTTVNAQG